jgi:hypothetical protein
MEAEAANVAGAVVCPEPVVESVAHPPTATIRANIPAAGADQVPCARTHPVPSLGDRRVRDRQAGRIIMPTSTFSLPFDGPAPPEPNVLGLVQRVASR